MPRKIIEMVRAHKDTLKANRSLAERNAVLGTAALHGGIRSAAWKTYMMQFIEQEPRGTPLNAKQLERLLGTDGTLGDPDLDRKRAYLVGNSPCGSTTPDGLDSQVNSIDVDLGSGCLPSSGEMGGDDDNPPPRERRTPHMKPPKDDKDKPKWQ